MGLILDKFYQYTFGDEITGTRGLFLATVTAVTKKPCACVHDCELKVGVSISFF